MNTLSHRTVAVDLTPIISGGSNGGAKIFVVELIKQMATLSPKTKFVLFTHERSHEELFGYFMGFNNIYCSQAYHNSEKLTLKILRACKKYLIIFQQYEYLKIISISAKIINIISKKLLNSQKFLLKNIDLVFCPFTEPNFLFNSTPVVSVIYDLQYKIYPMFFTKEEIFSRENSFKKACEKANFLVSISQFTRQSLQQEGIEDSRVKTIYIRMACRLSDKHSDVRVLERNMLSSKKYLIYPANFWAHKNHEMLLVAFSMARTKGLPREIKLVLTGERSSRQEILKGTARKMGLDGVVVFTNFVSNSEYSTLLANAGAMVFPSLYEGFGMPTIEAMSFGVPIACSNAGSLSEIVGDAAIFFRPSVPEDISEAMWSLFFDESLRNKLIRNGHRRARYFSDSKLMAAEYLEVFSYALNLQRLQ